MNDPASDPEQAGLTRRVVRTESRRRPLRIGIALGVIGVGLFAAGVITLSATENAEVLGAVDRVAVGSPITYEAEARSYSLVFLRAELDTEAFRRRAVANLRCEVELADGSTALVEGRRQAVYSEFALGSSIGTFDAPSGPTTVRCDFVRNPGGILQNYAVAPNRQAVKIVGWVLSGVGALLSMIGISLVVIGVRGRPVIERVPVPIDPVSPTP